MDSLNKKQSAHNLLISIAKHLKAKIEFVNYLDDYDPSEVTSGSMRFDDIAISFNFDRYNNKGKFNFDMDSTIERHTSMFEHMPYEYRTTHFSINCSGTKTSLQIAKDIQKRLLTDEFRAAFAGMLKSYQDHLEHASKHTEMLKTICNLVGERVESFKPDASSVRSYSKGLEVGIKYDLTLNLKLEKLSYCEVEKILKMLGKI